MEVLATSSLREGLVLQAIHGVWHGRTSDARNELAPHRAKFAREALASSQGDFPPDRYLDLSPRQTAELLGEEIPKVQGANSIRTEAYNARARARREEAALWSKYDESPFGAEDRSKEIRMHRHTSMSSGT